MYDLLIQGARIVDGLGGPPYRADIATSKDRIAAIGPPPQAQAARVIDATGLCAAPGFIDAHTHSDLPLLADPLAQSKVRQGVTTEVIGNCGSSCAPLTGDALAGVRRNAELLELDVGWRSFGAYLERLSATGTAVNVVPQVGHNTVRAAVMGAGDEQPDTDQLSAMERCVEQAMDEGARGLSTGLYYPPGAYARTPEVVALARVAARRGGFYTSHIRSESDGLLDAVQEAAEIGRQAQLPVEIAHVKASGYRNWDKADALVDLLEQTRTQGVQLICDQYPYHASSTWLASMLPYWAQSGGGAGIAARLRDPACRRQLHQDLEANRAAWENRSGVRDGTGIMISSCPARPELQGQTVAALAASAGGSELDAVLDLLIETQCQVSCVWFSQSEEVVKRLMRLPFVAIGSDAGALSPHGLLGRRQSHPRSYGTFARVLGRYCRQDGVLSLADAVRKMTSLPATHMGLRDRGAIRVGAMADLVLFDADRVLDQATFDAPHQYATGISWVLCNGQPVIQAGEHTGALPGRVL